MTALSAVYGRLARVRRSWYARRPDRRARLARPVISVGNLVVGGSGKTPVVAALARLLQAHGERPAILSRGYARRQSPDGVVVVSDGTRLLSPVERAGDEPYMLARTLGGVPVLVSPDRYLAGRVAERSFASTVLLLDDGFQHLQLKRDVDLLVVSPSDLKDRLLPAGRLREPLEAARQADALLVAGGEDDARRVADVLGVPVAFHLTPQYEPLRLLNVEPIPSDAPSCCGRVLAVAGIARPERFFTALGELGWNVARQMAFPDHHWFRPRDVQAIEREARDMKADLVVTTEKDAARLDVVMARTPVGSPDGPGKDQPTVLQWAVLPMSIAIEPADAFAHWLGDRLQRART